MTAQSNGIRTDQGFTLLEVAFVVLIIGILLGIAIATFAATTSTADAAACLSNQDALNKAIVIASSAGTTITAMDDLEPFVKNFHEIIVCPDDGTPLTFDAAHSEVSCPNHP